MRLRESSFVSLFLLATACGADEGSVADTDPATVTSSSGDTVDPSSSTSTDPTLGTEAVSSSSTSTGAAESSSSSTGEPPVAGSYRRPITIRADAIDEPLAAFVVTIDVVDPALRPTSEGGHLADADARDVVFFDVDGVTPLSAEVATYDSAAGHVVAFVKLPSIDDTVDTTIWMAYGDPDRMRGPAAEVWWPSHLGAWHFDDELDDGQVTDSSANANHADVLGASTDAGRLGAALHFGDADDRAIVTFPEPVQPEARTITAWARMDGSLASNGRQRIWMHGPFYEQVLEVFVEDETLRFGRVVTTLNAWSFDTGADIPDFAYGDWHHYALVYFDDGASNDYNYLLYVDGELLFWHNDIGLPNPAQLFFIGNIDAAGADLIGPRNFNGLIDELRFDTVARPEAWIRAEFRNVADPSGFYSVGAEEEA